MNCYYCDSVLLSYNHCYRCNPCQSKCIGLSVRHYYNYNSGLIFVALVKNLYQETVIYRIKNNNYTFYVANQTDAPQLHFNGKCPITPENFDSETHRLKKLIAFI